MIMSDNKRGGLSNKEALRVFIKKFDEFIEKIDSFIPSKERKISFVNILDYVVISYLLIIGISEGVKIRLFPDSRDHELSLLITIILILIIFFSILICHKVLKKQKITKNLLSFREEMIKNINSCTDKNFKYFTNLEEYEGNFYCGYNHCFVETLRNQEWVKIPKNVIVEGDYIKINIGDKSPADVKCVDYRHKPVNKKWDFCLKKGEVFKGFEETYSLDSHLEMFTQNKYDIFFKTKDEWVFEVINDPFLDILEVYVKNYQVKSISKEMNDNITSKTKYLKFALFIFNIMLIILMLFWIIYNIESQNKNNQTTNTQHYQKDLRAFFLIMNHPLTFFVTFIYIYFKFIQVFLIYWANATIYILRSNLINDYQGKSTIKNTNDLLQLKTNSIESIIIQKDTNNFRSENEDTKNLHDKNYFQATNFNEFSFKEHISFYSQFFQEGIEKTYNLLKVSENINRLCFLDKEGLMFEKEKEVVEIAFFKSNNNLEILNVQCEEAKASGRETNFYQIEENNEEEYINNLKPIALCSSVIKIPKENYKTNDLIFLELNKIKNMKKIMPVSKLSKYSRSFKGKSDYLFSATQDHLRLYFKDCLCLLSKSIGFTDNILKSYKNIKNLWHTNLLKFENSEHSAQKKVITENLDETEESIIIYESSFERENLIQIQNENEADLVISSIIQDEMLNNMSYFTRGSPNSILNLCEDFWNGRTIEQLNGEIIQKVSSLMQQWQSSNIQPIAFSYKPTKKSINDIIEKYNLDLELTDKNILHILKHNSLPQIFLGMVAMKNNLKNSFQDLLETLNDAGIVFVFFSKEDEKNTKKLADIILCEYDFNQCISLKSDCGDDTRNRENEKKKSNFQNKKKNVVLKKEINENHLSLNENEEENIKMENINIMLNQEGNKYLPTGVNEIREFLEKKDEVPLQINLFSDSSNINDVVDILEIYQDYGEVIGCFTSTLNYENIPALAIADINFGVNIKPSFECQMCNGMRNDFLVKKSPTIFEYLSMKINSIFCPFVIDENTNYSSITRILFSARFLNYRIKLILKYFIHLIYYLIFLQLPSYVIMSSPILDSYSIIFILFILFPIMTLAMLTINDNFDHIKKLKSSKRIKEKLAEHESKLVKIILKFLFTLLIVGSNIIIVNSIFFTKIEDFSVYLIRNLKIKNNFTNTTSNLTLDNTHFINLNYVPFYLDLLVNRSSSVTYYLEKEVNLSNLVTTNLEYMRVVNFYVVVWFILCLSFLYIHKLDSVFSCSFFSNCKFVLLNLLILVFASVKFIIRILNFENVIILEYEHYHIIIFTVGTFAIFIFDHLKKIYINKIQFSKQKNIKLIIETRLGTYSPK